MAEYCYCRICADDGSPRPGSVATDECEVCEDAPGVYCQDCGLMLCADCAKTDEHWCGDDEERDEPENPNDDDNESEAANE